VIPAFETGRLLLRAFERDDVDRFAAISANPEVMRFIGNGQPLDRAASWRAMASFLGHWTLRGYGQWAMVEKATGLLIGRVGLWNPEGWPGLEVGWLLDRSAWDRGYATEGAGAALDHAFEVVGADQIISAIQPENARSIRVAERIGEIYIGQTSVEARDVVVYGIDRARWLRSERDGGPWRGGVRSAK
jgi:RimJ/RimL family protein N-acetyltransferase